MNSSEVDTCVKVADGLTVAIGPRSELVVCADRRGVKRNASSNSFTENHAFNMITRYNIIATVGN